MAPGHRGTAAAWVTSPHLLVAQAVAAALRSAGLPAPAAPWDPGVHQRELADDERGTGLRPVVVILDGAEGPEVIDDLAQLLRGGRVRLMVVTSESAAVSCGSLLASDHVEVVTQVLSLAELADVVRLFVDGQPVMTLEARATLRAEWVRAVEQHRHLASVMQSLTPQQRRVLGLLASGHRVAEVGSIIGVTGGTVRSHVKSLRAKLGVRTQLEAVAMLRHMQVAEAWAAHDHEHAHRDDAVVPRPRLSDPAEQWETTPRR